VTTGICAHPRHVIGGAGAKNEALRKNKDAGFYFQEPARTEA
jgi:hypothetical protein